MLVSYTERPESVFCHVRPDGMTEVYLRKNITETEDGWTAEEVTFTGFVVPSEITEDFDAYWQQAERAAMKPTERIEALEAENAELREIVGDLAEGIAEIYEGGVSVDA